MAPHFADLFEHAADAFPGRVAVICGQERVTYAELEERVNRLAHCLKGGGVGPGDHVGLFARNSIPAVETILAACKLRASPVNINYRFTETELRYMLADADPVALVHDQELTPLVWAAAGSAPSLQTTVTVGDGAPASHAGHTELTYDEALARGSAERDFGPRSADDVYLIYTGGTTGYPKGVMWRHEDIWRTLAGGIDFATGVPLPDERAQVRAGQQSGGAVRLNVAPLIHGAAQVSVLGGLFCGDTVVLMRRFDADEIWRAVGAHRVATAMVIGDAMARPLIDAYRASAETGSPCDASSLVVVTSSGALFSAGVREECARALPGVVFTDAVGSTETGFTGMGLAGGGGTSTGTADRGGPTVRPGPGTIVIRDDNRPAGPGETGRLGRGGHVPLGYYKDPGKTAALFTDVGGVRYAVPGDLARVEEDGSITLLGRGSTCVNTGGEKVFPEEVESALKSHPDVFDAVVVGLPDERLGQRVAALIAPRPGREIDLAALTEYARGHIAGYKIPRSVWLVNALSRTVTGKPDYGWARLHAQRHAPDQSIP
jgi:acyl-CoA synthetase (AMP-forming)/AMP-acid ligase II